MIDTKTLPKDLEKIKELVYDPCYLVISDLIIEQESKIYSACRFTLGKKNIIYRNAKITPKKAGQFVTFWKRNKNKITVPFDENDRIDFYIVTVSNTNHFGQFIFPRSILIKKGILSTYQKKGKRGFRVYPIWNIPDNKQAEKTQQWQLNYFTEVHRKTNLEYVKKLFSEKKSNH